MTRQSPTKTKKKTPSKKKVVTKTSSVEITNKLFESVKQTWNKYAYIPADIYTMRDMMREFTRLKLSNIQIFMILDHNPTIPRLRFTYRGKNYIWSEAFMVQE